MAIILETGENKMADDAADDGIKPDDAGGERPGWIAQVPDDLKSNKILTSYKTVGDFAKAHIDTLGKVELLEGRVASSIPKLSEKATDDEKAAYYKALGVPDAPDLYEFPKGEGVEHDPVMIKWAQGVFHEAKLSAEQAKLIGQKWDMFVNEMASAQMEAVDRATTAAKESFDKKWGKDAPARLELVRRFYAKVTGADKFNEKYGNDFEAIDFISEVAKAVGDDFIPPRAPARSGKDAPGIIYDKSPPPPKRD
jgi:hypothetical protein